MKIKYFFPQNKFTDIIINLKMWIPHNKKPLHLIPPREGGPVNRGEQNQYLYDIHVAFLVLGTEEIRSVCDGHFCGGGSQETGKCLPGPPWKV